MKGQTTIYRYNGEGSMRKDEKGKQYRSWLGIEVKSEYMVYEENGKTVE